MSFRTIVVTNKCKLSYKSNHLIIRKEDVQMIHLSEINMIVIDTTQVSITTYLISELSKKKIKVIFCDELKNPIAELVPYYGSHNTSKKVLSQIKWEINIKEIVWKHIIKDKIQKQADILRICQKENSEKLESYIPQVQNGDKTNREGHAAKVYFNSLFGKDFVRDSESNYNAALDYGYTILLSFFNREIVAKGYITQLGLNHRNEFNFFNLSCDLMEPFRPLIDQIVYQVGDQILDGTYKYTLINVLNLKVRIDNKEQFLSNAIGIYVNSIFDAIEKNDESLLKVYEL